MAVAVLASPSDRVSCSDWARNRWSSTEPTGFSTLNRQMARKIYRRWRSMCKSLRVAMAPNRARWARTSRSSPCKLVWWGLGPLFQRPRRAQEWELSAPKRRRQKRRPLRLRQNPRNWQICRQGHPLSNRRRTWGSTSRGSRSGWPRRRSRMRLRLSREPSSWRIFRSSKGRTQPRAKAQMRRLSISDWPKAPSLSTRMASLC